MISTSALNQSPKNWSITFVKRTINKNFRFCNLFSSWHEKMNENTYCKTLRRFETFPILSCITIVSADLFVAVFRANVNASLLLNPDLTDLVLPSMTTDHLL